MTMLTPKEVATLFDGEGWIGDAVREGNPYPVLSVCMTVPFYPKTMHEQFGGCLNTYSPRNPKYKLRWHWRVHGKDCESVLLYCIAELKIKKSQGELVLGMIPTLVGSGNKLSPLQEMLRWKIHEALRYLNKVGRHDEVEKVIESLEEK